MCICYVLVAYLRYDLSHIYCFFFFNDTATTEIYTLSLHDALPISFIFDPLEENPYLTVDEDLEVRTPYSRTVVEAMRSIPWADRKSTRLNSSHANISYAVFCLKKKKIYI